MSVAEPREMPLTEESRHPGQGSGGRFQLPGGLARFGWMWPVVAALRVFWWTFQLLDSAVEKVVRKFLKTRWVREGACGQSGECCEVILMVAPRFFERRPGWLAAFAALGEVLYPFRFQQISQDQRLMMTCENFDSKARHCRNHRFRPKICRDYPPVEFFKRPALFRGCGFQIHLRQNGFAEALKRASRATASHDSLPSPPSSGDGPPPISGENS